MKPTNEPTWLPTRDQSLAVAQAHLDRAVDAMAEWFTADQAALILIGFLANPWAKR